VAEPPHTFITCISTPPIQRRRLSSTLLSFDCEQRQFLDHDAVWTEQSWLLFNKVKSSPPWQLTSAIWHFGWGAEDMKAEYQKQIDSGTKFFTPLTDISDILGGTSTGRFFYAYVETPDHGLVELNTARSPSLRSFALVQ
jgi:hypothetical protein